MGNRYSKPPGEPVFHIPAQHPIADHFVRGDHHRRQVIQYPTTSPSPLIRLELTWDEREPKAVKLAEKAAQVLQMLAIQDLLEGK